MSEFDKVILGESKNLYKLHSDVLRAKYKTEAAAIAGISSEIRKVLAKYEGQRNVDRELVQGDIARCLRAMVAN